MASQRPSSCRVIGPASGDQRLNSPQSDTRRAAGCFRTKLTLTILGRAAVWDVFVACGAETAVGAAEASFAGVCGGALGAGLGNSTLTAPVFRAFFAAVAACCCRTC